jgi:hypothetical protein
MGDAHYRIRFLVGSEASEVVLAVLTGSLTLAEAMQEALAAAGRDGAEVAGWSASREGTDLDTGRTLAELFGPPGGEVVVQLLPRAAKPPSPAGRPLPGSTRSRSAPVEEEEHDLALEEDEETDRAARFGAAGGIVERRSTVRYYDRMNPDRVYPLLVVHSEGQALRSRNAVRASARADCSGSRSGRSSRSSPCCRAAR